MSCYFCFIEFSSHPFYMTGKKRDKMETSDGADCDWTPFKHPLVTLLVTNRWHGCCFCRWDFSELFRKKRKSNFATTIVQSQPTASAVTTWELIAFSQYLFTRQRCGEDVSLFGAVKVIHAGAREDHCAGHWCNDSLIRTDSMLNVWFALCKMKMTINIIVF